MFGAGLLQQVEVVALPAKWSCWCSSHFKARYSSKMHLEFPRWLQQELGRIPGAIDLGMTSEWSVVDRIMYFISASPGFDFAMRHKVPPRILQPKYMILVSNGGQVRVAWFAFVSNHADPGATAGPFVVKLVSEDLRSADRGLRTFSKFTYTTRAASCSDMEKIISAMVPSILKGVDQDKWDAFERA